MARPSSAAQHLPGEAKTPLGSCGEVTCPREVVLVLSIPSHGSVHAVPLPGTHHLLTARLLCVPGRRRRGRAGMLDWSMPLSSLGEDVLFQLCELLDNAGRGWRRLAEVAGAEKRFKCR